ncbi:CLUMA_CG010800, isoform A [Clunio marinus]|uniref:CLUMA_CG010800, isoform A n=1 Tax=Clunio marinus TaxID=568069 RepID=A0A1J1IB25_9DIPT|nr:CLUMA_CG010800, isoform A [Clunio marinus]
MAWFSTIGNRYRKREKIHDIEGIILHKQLLVENFSMEGLNFLYFVFINGLSDIRTTFQTSLGCNQLMECQTALDN